MAIDSARAVSGTGVDAGVAWHYGDPLGEQRALHGGAAVIDRSNRDVVIVSGPDRLPWLHSICSQHVAELAEGAVTESLVLSPHGHVEQHWVVTARPDAVWIDTEPGAAPVVLGYLHAMQFLKRVESRDGSADWGVVSLAGPHAADVAATASLPVPEPGHALEHGAGFVRRVAPLGIDQLDVLVPRAQVRATVDALVAAGATAAGMWSYEALRVQARRPRLGFETDHRTIPHEVGWIGTAVHLDKGCYRGQETVARVQNLGRPPRRLVLLHLAGESDELPPPGTAVELDGRPVGFLGTAVHHHELGPVALAVIKRSTPDNAALIVAGSAAAIDPV